MSWRASVACAWPPKAAAMSAVAPSVFVAFTSAPWASRVRIAPARFDGLIAAVSVQGLAKDIVAGLFVLVEDTYGIGDYVDTTFGAAVARAGVIPAPMSTT